MVNESRDPATADDLRGTDCLLVENCPLQYLSDGEVFVMWRELHGFYEFLEVRLHRQLDVFHVARTPVGFHTLFTFNKAARQPSPAAFPTLWIISISQSGKSPMISALVRSTWVPKAPANLTLSTFSRFMRLTITYSRDTEHLARTKSAGCPSA